MRSATALILIVAASGAAFGQTFEAASIRVRQGAPQWKFAISGTRLTIESYTLFGLIQEAYNLQNYEVRTTGGPPLLLSNDTLYDVTAKAEGDGAPTRDQFRQMLQALLADRFKLKVHREPVETPVYALIVGRGGPKFKPSLPDAAAQTHFSLSGPNYQATMPSETMDDLAKKVLSPVSGRPVVDETGLTGTYNIALTYKPENQINRGPEADTREISIFTAVQDQLGLKLEPLKAMIDTLVVDHVEKPSEN